MKRGEIWTASGGPDYAGKPRPVLIVQDDIFSETASITICLLTTEALDAPLVRLAIEPDANNGLLEISYAMADKVTTVSPTKMGTRIGALPPAAMTPISRAITLFLGLAP